MDVKLGAPFDFGTERFLVGGFGTRSADRIDSKARPRVDPSSGSVSGRASLGPWTVAEWIVHEPREFLVLPVVTAFPRENLSGSGVVAQTIADDGENLFGLPLVRSPEDAIGQAP